MRIIDAGAVAALAPYRDVVEALRAGFRSSVHSPKRHHHDVSAATTLLLMPAWSKDWTGLKTVVVKTDNAEKGLPTVQASYLLIDNASGSPVAILDGTELTRRRTAAASALAADYLARKDAAYMVLVGAGALAAHFARAHASVRPLKRIAIYNRSPMKATQLAEQLRSEGFDAVVAGDLEAEVRRADIVSCVTSSVTPIVRGAWLKLGAHVDLAGAFKPSMRETDGEAVMRSRVFVDDREGAQAEAGDLIQAANEGLFDFSSVQGDLAQLCSGRAGGRRSEDEITLFKSCGTAIEDLATAVMIYEKSR